MYAARARVGAAAMAARRGIGDGFAASSAGRGGARAPTAHDRVGARERALHPGRRRHRVRLHQIVRRRRRARVMACSARCSRHTAVLFRLATRTCTRKAARFAADSRVTSAFHDPRAAGDPRPAYAALSGRVREARVKRTRGLNLLARARGLPLFHTAPEAQARGERTATSSSSH